MQIFYGLREILGKKIPVGTESMTWRLVKYIESDISKLDTSNKEDLVEVYSKLNVALNVMHECFEPVKESRTRRDLMEDVIFNRWYAHLIFILLSILSIKASLQFMSMQL